MRLSCAAALAAATISTTALGAGYEYPDNGSVGLGRAGAMAAKADDGTAVYYNPSGLADQSGLRIMADGMFSNASIAFQRTDQNGVPIGPTVANSGGTFVAPFVTLSYQIIPGLTVALGAYGPPADGRYQFPSETPPSPSNPNANPFGSPPTPSGPGGAPQKYMLIQNNIFVFYPTASIAWRPVRWVAFGASLQLVDASTFFQQATYDGALLDGKTTTPSSESASRDTIASANVADNPIEVLAGIFGVTVNPTDRLRIGASYRPGFTTTQTGTLGLDYSTLAQDVHAKVSGNGTTQAKDGTSGSGPAQLVVPFPGEFKSGVGYAWGSGLTRGSDVELDFDYDQWSQLKQLALTPGFNFQTDLSNAQALPAIEIPKNFQDAWSLRLGSDFRLPVRGPIRLTARAGLGYESSVYASSGTIYPTIDFPNFAQFVGSAGFSIGWRMLDLDLGYAHVYEPTAQVRSSGVVMTANQPPPGYSPEVVGNGNFVTSYDVFSAGLRLRFL